MFPSNKSDEMNFHVSSNISQQQNIIPQDLIFTARAIDSVDSTVHTTNNINLLGQGCQGTQLVKINNLYHGDDDDNNINNQNKNINNKKIIRREVEKQRRKEMASLHSELRSLIPLEYIKGKRSISDHMDTATNYIKYLKVKISKLSVRRDDLIKESNCIQANNSGNSSSHQFGVSSCFAVNHCSVGVEIVLSSTNYNSSNNGHILPLSTVLQLLLGKGLILFSCVTSKVSEKFLMHTIQAEVGDEIYINLAELRQTLNDTISMQN